MQTVTVPLRGGLFRRNVRASYETKSWCVYGRRPQRFSDVGVLLLAVEVLSRSTRRTDRHDKRTLHQDERVTDYWIVDTSSRTIEHWTPEATEPHVRTTTLVWQPVPTHEPLVIDVVEHFRNVWGE